MNEEWITIHDWPGHQHYGNRDPNWIKDHLSQHGNDRYLDLTFALRGLMKDLRLAYAASDGILLLDLKKLSRRFGQRVTRAQLDLLNHAGFIHFVASKPLALARSREKKERREETRVRAPASDERPRAPAQTPEPDRDAALAEAFDIAASWDGPQDTLAFEDALDQVARRHHTKIPALDRDRLWDIALGNHHDTH